MSCGSCLFVVVLYMFCLFRLCLDFPLARIVASSNFNALVLQHCCCYFHSAFCVFVVFSMDLLRRSYIQYLGYRWPVHPLAFVQNTFYTRNLPISSVISIYQQCSCLACKPCLQDSSFHGGRRNKTKAVNQT